MLVAVHGYAQAPEELLAYGQRVAPEDTAVLVPCGPYAWEGVRGWVVRETREADERRNAEWLDAIWDEARAVHALDPDGMALLGYSQGVGVALTWLLDTRRRASAFVGLAGGLRVPLRERLRELTATRTLWVTGRHDRAYPVAYTEELLPALAGAGLRVESHVLDTGHRLLEPAAPLVASFLAGGATDRRPPSALRL